MPTTHPRVYTKDEELGKRDDDFRPKRWPTDTSLLRPWRGRKRRLLSVLAIAALVVYVVRNILPVVRSSSDGDGAWAGLTDRKDLGKPTSQGHAEPTGPPPRARDAGKGEESKHYYDGIVKFYRLAKSLHAISRTMGARPSNRNILFATSSLQSAANLMPMACEMAKWDRNYVHVALMGRANLPLAAIQEVNGFSDEFCTVFFHDARSDYSEYSSAQRAEAAVAGAMKHINDFIHPQAIIMDDSSLEDAFFTRAMRGKAKEMDRALIEIPAGRYEEFMWMTRLDSGSLSNWFKPQIDILVHAPAESSGGLIMLMKSLEAADYAGLQVPRLTIELPSSIDPFARRYFSDLNWPPINHASGQVKQNTLTLRHRIPSSRMSSEQAAVRFAESFFPKSTDDNHVLILSPQAELSPLFLQYLHYVSLEYKYSSYGSPESGVLLGVSLDVPSNFLNGSAGFKGPKLSDMQATRYTDRRSNDQAGPAPFLYQAPSATANLIFGDKWATFHDFLTNRLTSSHAGRAQKTKKLVSEAEPAWTEFLLELMLARGWSMLHPAQPFVTVHNELRSIPEEYLREPGAVKKGTKVPQQSDHAEEEPFLTAPEAPVLEQRIERGPAALQSLHKFLPFEGDLEELPHLPYLSYKGDMLSKGEVKNLTEEYVPVLRRTVGGCSAEDAKRKRVVSDVRTTEDLFCLPGQVLEFDYVGEESDEDFAEAVIAENEEVPAVQWEAADKVDTSGESATASAGAMSTEP